MKHRAESSASLTEKEKRRRRLAGQLRYGGCAPHRLCLVASGRRRCGFGARLTAAAGVLLAGMALLGVLNEYFL